MKLTVLIPTVEGREEVFNSLTTYLGEQIINFGLQSDVSIKHLLDNKEISIGEKRNQLLQMADGDYCVMIDDDDWIHHEYLPRLIAAMETSPNCIGYKELCIFNGKKVASSCISKKYSQWKDHFDGYDYVRSPFYKIPIKTEIARLVKFKSMRFGEDHAYAKEIYQYIKSEVFIDEFMITYRYTQQDHNSKYGIKK